VGVKIVTNLNVIEIVDEKYPYPSLLWIEWAFENNVVISLKKESMFCEAIGA
jgi:hypothetical protein